MITESVLLEEPEIMREKPQTLEDMKEDMEMLGTPCILYSVTEDPSSYLILGSSLTFTGRIYAPL